MGEHDALARGFFATVDRHDLDALSPAGKP
jgi:hypothetical protein